MKIGIAYDTKEMYDDKDDLYYDFADEVSISQLDAAFRSLGHETVRIKSFAELLEICKGKECPCDLVYNTMEGISSRNREGFAPSLLEMYRVPFMGTDAFGLSLTLNKYLTKIVAQNYGIATPISALVMPSDSRRLIVYYSQLASVNLHITPHMFRHTFASALLDQGVDIRYIQEMLGHSSIHTTEIYTHVSLSRQKYILCSKHPRNTFHL